VRSLARTPVAPFGQRGSLQRTAKRYHANGYGLAKGHAQLKAKLSQLEPTSDTAKFPCLADEPEQIWPKFRRCAPRLLFTRR